MDDTRRSLYVVEVPGVSLCGFDGGGLARSIKHKDKFEWKFLKHHEKDIIQSVTQAT